MAKQKMIFVKPAPVKGSGKLGLIRDPITRAFLAEEGEWKPENTYWLRRVKFKDVIQEDKAEPKPEAPAAKAPKAEKGAAK